MNLDKQRVAHQFNKSAYVYDQHSGMQREIVDALLAKADVKRILSPQKAGVPVVCDLGCGTGYALSRVASEVSPCYLVGLDLAPAMLELAADRLADINNQYLNLSLIHI